MTSRHSNKSLLKGINKLVFFNQVSNNSSFYSTNNSWSFNLGSFFWNYIQQRLNTRPNKPVNTILTSNNLNSTPIKNKYAVLVGINYTGTPNELNGCINDMNNLNKYLLKENYQKSNIKLLSDDSKNLPTKKNILDSFKLMLKKAKSGDQCVFTYSGHGFQTYNTDGSEIDGRDECLLSSKLFCLMDCCHSGTILDLRYNYKYTILNKQFYENKKETIPQGEVVMISGCMDKQYSMDAYIKNKYQGAMTNSFLENVSKSINWSALVNKMRDTLIKGSFTQVPQLSSGRMIKLDSKVVI